MPVLTSLPHNKLSMHACSLSNEQPSLPAQAAQTWSSRQTSNCDQQLESTAWTHMHYKSKFMVLSMRMTAMLWTANGRQEDPDSCALETYCGLNKYIQYKHPHAVVFTRLIVTCTRQRPTKLVTTFHGCYTMWLPIGRGGAATERGDGRLRISGTQQARV